MAVKTIYITAKCSDQCAIAYYDENNQVVGNSDGYVPDFMPNEHYGDYIEIEIEIATGQILGWKKPTQKELKDEMR